MKTTTNEVNENMQDFEPYIIAVPHQTRPYIVDKREYLLIDEGSVMAYIEATDKCWIADGYDGHLEDCELHGEEQYTEQNGGPMTREEWISGGWKDSFDWSEYLIGFESDNAFDGHDLHSVKVMDSPADEDLILDLRHLAAQPFHQFDRVAGLILQRREDLELDGSK